MSTGSSRKKQRVGSSSRLSSSHPSPTSPKSGETSPPLRRPATTPTISGGFNDPSTADILLRLHLAGTPDSSDPPSLDLHLHLHSSALLRSHYFSARLSGRWPLPDPPPLLLTLHIQNPTNLRRPFDAHLAVLRLLYTLDFPAEILSVTDALELLPVALELLFDDCVRACVQFLESVPWTEEEEQRVLALIPFLNQEESADLITRLFPTVDDGKKNASEEMLHGLILKVMHGNPGWASVKAFVAKLLRDYAPRDAVKRVLDRAFLGSLGTVRELLGECASPDVRVSGGDEETEAIQRVKIHTAKVNVRNLLWLVDRMLELRVGDRAAEEWSEQAALAVDLQKTFRDDTWRNIAPGLPTLVLRCTGRLGSAIAVGSILAPRRVCCCSIVFSLWLMFMHCSFF